jgi:type IV pilus assembly protein PilB
VPAVNLDEYEIDPRSSSSSQPRAVCEKHKIIPISRSGSSLIVAMADPTNLHAIDDLKFLTGLQRRARHRLRDGHRSRPSSARTTATAPQYDEVHGGVRRETDIEATVEDEDVNVLELEKQAEGAPVVRLVNMILSTPSRRARATSTSSPTRRSLRVRYRVDGVLIEEMKPPPQAEGAISSRLKIMSQLDIAERRLPQDGRIKLKIGKGREMDFRVSVLPTLWGEKIVMRLLDKGNLQLDMTKLGFDQKPLDDFQWAIHQPWGMVLVTGPTGSGKTTTLYSALSDLNKVGTNISTAEDPVEYNLHGINQVQMHDEIGLNFAAWLRSFLRQDPDIIMVGEIRDFETAEIAVKAALTGHMVLSTLHTNDAPPPSRASSTWASSRSSSRRQRQPRPRPAPRAARSVWTASSRSRSTTQVLVDIGFTAEQIARMAGSLMKGAGLQDVQRHGLQGPRRALRGHALHREAEGDGAPGRVDRRAQGGAIKRGMMTPAHVAASRRSSRA